MIRKVRSPLVRNPECWANVSIQISSVTLSMVIGCSGEQFLHVFKSIMICLCLFPLSSEDGALWWKLMWNTYLSICLTGERENFACNRVYSISSFHNLCQNICLMFQLSTWPWIKKHPQIINAHTISYITGLISGRFNCIVDSSEFCPISILFSTTPRHVA